MRRARRFSRRRLIIRCLLRRRQLSANVQYRRVPHCSLGAASWGLRFRREQQFRNLRLWRFGYKSNVRRALACPGDNRAYIANVSQMQLQMRRWCLLMRPMPPASVLLNLQFLNSTLATVSPAQRRKPRVSPPAPSPCRRRGFPPSIRKPELGSLSKFVSALPKCAIPVVCLVNHIWAPTSESFRHGPCLGIPNRYPDLIDERIFH